MSFQPTVSLKETNIEYIFPNPFHGFRNYPIFEIRRACLDAIKKMTGYTHPSHFEDTITELLGLRNPTGNSTDRGFAIELLEVYLSKQYEKDRLNEPASLRAFSFAVELSKVKVSPSLILKLVGASIKAHGLSQEEFNGIGGINELIMERLSSFQAEALDMIDGGYLEQDWYDVERAVRLIVEYNLLGFSPRLEMMASEFRNGKYLFSSEESSSKRISLEMGKHQGFILAAVRLLRKEFRKK